MIKVAGYWELGWSTPIKDIELWEYWAKDFNVEEIYMCPLSGIDPKRSIVPLTEKEDVQQAIDENPKLTTVWVESNGKTPLKKFKHPKNALYIVGKEGLNPYTVYGKPKDKSVKIEVPGAGFWGHQAMCLVLYDRFIKNGGNSN